MVRAMVRGQFVKLLSWRLELKAFPEAVESVTVWTAAGQAHRVLAKRKGFPVWCPREAALDIS